MVCSPTSQANHRLTLPAGVNGTGSSHAPSIRVDGLPSGDAVRSPVMLTPTTTESAGLPTPVAAEPAPSAAEAKTRPAIAHTKSTDSTTPAVLPKTSDGAQVKSHKLDSGQHTLTFL